jgi:hypothetical protein
MRSVIWIDDDAGYMLQPLARMLKRRGFEVTVYSTYEEAATGLDHLGEKAKVSGERFPNVISDLLIPSGSKVLDTEENALRLIRKSLVLGAKRVVVLSVAVERVSSELSSLQSEFPCSRILCLEKTAADPAELLDTLIAYLSEN